VGEVQGVQVRAVNKKGFSENAMTRLAREETMFTSMEL
jgi:hypothetical protein